MVPDPDPQHWFVVVYFVVHFRPLLPAKRAAVKDSSGEESDVPEYDFGKLGRDLLKFLTP